MKALVLRFSAMGDVALTLPAIRKAVESNPTLDVYFVSNSKFGPLFHNIPRFHFIGIDLTHYKGFLGLFRMISDLKKITHFDALIDLHDSLRTKVIRSVFALTQIKIAVIDKGRLEKRKLTARRHKTWKPLRHAVVRYEEVFYSVGLKMEDNTSVELPSIRLAGQVTNKPWRVIDSYKTVIGFAPFAGFALKELPIDKQTALVRELTQIEACAVILFGGKAHYAELAALAGNYKNVFVAGDLVTSFEEDLHLISRLNLMISMDSANLHLAALLGTKVLGVYGTTHPYLGFAPYLQEEGTFGLSGLPCRPCTVYGKGECWRGDIACMKEITVPMLMQKIRERIN